MTCSYFADKKKRIRDIQLMKETKLRHQNPRWRLHGLKTYYLKSKLQMKDKVAVEKNFMLMDIDIYFILFRCNYFMVVLKTENISRIEK